MHDELEAALKELEAKLPTLRHLILDSGDGMASSPVALALAARLLRLTAMADETASNLRLALLGSNPLPPKPLPAMPLYLPEPEGAAVPPPPPPPADFLNEADHALLEIFGEDIGEPTDVGATTSSEVPQSPEGFEESLGALDATLDALDDASDRAADAKAALTRKVDTLQAKAELALKRGDRDLATALLKEKSATLLAGEKAGLVPPLADRTRRLFDELSAAENDPAAVAELSELERKLGIRPGVAESELARSIEELMAKAEQAFQRGERFESLMWLWELTLVGELAAKAGVIPAFTTKSEAEVETELSELARKLGLGEERREGKASWTSPEVLESEAFRGQLTHQFFREELLGEPRRTLGRDEIERMVRAVPTTIPSATALALVVRAVGSISGRPVDAEVTRVITQAFDDVGWIMDEGGDETPGNAPVPAYPKVPIPPRVPGNARTYEEALEPARNP